MISKAKPITTKREEAEHKMDRKVLGINSIKKSARYARSGDYESARLYSYSTTRLMSRNLGDSQSRSDYTSFVDTYEVLDKELLTAKKEEEEEAAKEGQSATTTTELNSANNYGYVSSAGTEALKTKRIATRAKCKDSTSRTLYKLSSVGYSVFSDDNSTPSSSPLPGADGSITTTTTTTTSTSTSTPTDNDGSVVDSLPEPEKPELTTLD